MTKLQHLEDKVDKKVDANRFWGILTLVAASIGWLFISFNGVSGDVRVLDERTQSTNNIVNSIEQKLDDVIFKIIIQK